MSKRRAPREVWIAAVLLLLVATVPWGFTRESSALWLGLPSWAFYSLAASVVFAVVVAVALRFAWPESPPGEVTPASRSGAREGRPRGE